MIKFKIYFDKDAETKWLNEMCEQGWAMQSFFAGFYTFDKCEPGKYIYQVDFGEKFFGTTDEYRELMKDMNITIIQNWGYWLILRKEASEGAFELYTDVESKIEHYTKIRNMFKIVTIIELICLFMEIGAACIGGVSAAAPCAFVILACVIAIFNATVRTNEIIDGLKEQQTGIATGNRKNVSPILAAGLLLNACALVMQDNISDYLKIGVQIVAIIFMCVGMWKTFRGRSVE